MAKRKKRKKDEASNFKYSVELTGLFLILVGIIGFGFGPVGSLLKKFSIFLVGTWWMFLLICLIILGSSMLFKRKKPKFFNSKLVGLYVVIIVVLVASHFGFIEHAKSGKQILSTTIDNFMERISTINGKTALFTSGTTSIEVGGGIIGALFAVVFSSLFGLSGTKVIEIILLLFGLILIFDITFADVINKLKAIFKREKKDDESIVPNDVEINTYSQANAFKGKDDKVVITDASELKTSIPKALENADTLAPQKDDGTGKNYKLPPLSILSDPEANQTTINPQETRKNKDALENVLKDFGIIAKVVKIHIGPAVTQYELTVPNGTKVNKITSVNKEIALAMAAKDVRIQAPIPGKSTIGIEIPNSKVSAVKIKEILLSKGEGKINVALGKDIMGSPYLADLSKMPHLLIAGSTGSGKSVCTNSIICSILMNYRPDEVKLVLVDPKKVELSNYNGVPHLLTPVVTDPKKASVALRKVVEEMERRYNLFSETKVKNIEGYNEYIQKENKKHPEAPLKKMHYLVTIIDELADLMLVASKEVEDSIMRITQMARAAGIHLIVATQRPSTDVITGVVKANIPSRIAFAVASGIDSRTILDMSGAEKLLGKGDMLYLPFGESIPVRIQGCFISDDEIRKLIDYVCKQQSAKYDEGMDLDSPSIGTSSGMESESGNDDPIYNEVVEFAMQTGKISASLIQRKFRLGYNRAARIIDLLEERGIVGPQNGSKPREVLNAKGHVEE